MITVRKSEARGHAKIDWLDARYTFSFADYHDPAHVHFGALRVMNEDVIGPGGGFAPHPHRDMEIVTYIISGALAHKDSLGNGSVIRPGEIQRMSAGTGIVHSEYNPSPSEPTHSLQIWILPGARGIAPSYEQKTIAPESVANRFGRIAAPDPGDNEVRLVQDAEIWSARLDAGAEASHALKPGRRAWLQIVRGEIDLAGMVLKQGDGAAVTDETALRLSAREPAELLLFDLA